MIRFRNPILKVIWCGFESDTLTLQNNGWQLSVEETVSHSSFTRMCRLAIHHPIHKLYGLSSHIELDLPNIYTKDPFEYFSKFNVPIPINQMASDLIMRLFEASEMKFHPFNAEPIYSRVEEKYASMAGMRIFEPIKHPENQIIVAPENVNNLLEQVLKLQDPKQKEIRENKRREMDKFLKECSSVGTARLDDKIIAEVLIGG